MLTLAGPSHPVRVRAQSAHAVAFARALEAANKLVVVGYAFADTHVNDLILEWLDGDPTRTITVLDPSWPRPEKAWTDVRAALTSELSRSHRIHVIRDIAARGLYRALTENTPVEPEPRLRTSVQWSGTTAEVTFLNLGEDLVDFSAGTGFEYHRPTSVILNREDARQVPDHPRIWSIPTLLSGDSVTAVATFESREPEAGFEVRGRGSVRDLALTVTPGDTTATLMPSR